MEFRSIFNLFLIIGAVQGFIFVIATFLLRKRIERPILYLNLFVLFLSLNNLQAWAIDKGLLSELGAYSNMEIPWYVLIVPMFYAFLIYYLGIEDKRLSFVTYSILLFVIALVLKLVIVYHIYQGNWESELLRQYKLLEDATVLSYSLFLYVKSIRLLYLYEQLYPEILTYDNLRWIKRFLRFGGVVFLLWLGAVLLNSFTSYNPPQTYYPLRLASSILIYWVGYQGFFRYVVLKDRIQLRSSIKDRTRKKDSPTNLAGQSESGNSFSRIKSILENDRVYLDPLLSQESLANTLGIGTSTLSKVVNDNFDGNFSDFINQYRVKEAMEILKNPDFDNYTIVAIGLECGFNSKSTFYAAFKKYTGHTPVNYRKSSG